MKRFLKPAYLPFAVLILGIATALFRLLFFSLGPDERGLYPTGSLFDIMSWVYVALAVVTVMLGCRTLKGNKEYALNFPAAPTSAIGIAVTAVAFCIATLKELSGETDPIRLAAAVLGFCAVAALLVLSFFRHKGLRPNLLLHTLVCVYLMIYMATYYRIWSTYPQLQNYAFELFAIAFTALACYQRAAFDAEAGNRQAYTFFSMLALFFAVAALPGSHNPAFCFGCALWMASTPCSLEPGEEVEEEPAEENAE